MQANRFFGTGFWILLYCSPTKAVVPCPAGYVADSSSDFCYKHMGNIAMPAAVTACFADGATLPLFRSAAEVAEARTLTQVSGTFWLGADDGEVERHWRLHGEGFISECGLTYENPAAYAKYALKLVNWGGGQPDNGNGGSAQNCAVVNAGSNQMDDYWCDRPVEAICQYRKCYQITKNPTLPTGETVFLAPLNQSCTKTCSENGNLQCDFSNLRSNSDLNVLKYLVQAAHMGGYKFAMPTANLALDVQKSASAPSANVKMNPAVIYGWRKGDVQSTCDGVDALTSNGRFCVCKTPDTTTTKYVPTTSTTTTKLSSGTTSEKESNESEDKGCKMPYVKGFKCWHVASVVALVVGIATLVIGGMALIGYYVIRQKKRTNG